MEYQLPPTVRKMRKMIDTARQASVDDPKKEVVFSKDIMKGLQEYGVPEFQFNLFKGFIVDVESTILTLLRRNNYLQRGKIRLEGKVVIDKYGRFATTPSLVLSGLVHCGLRGFIHKLIVC